MTPRIRSSAQAAKFLSVFIAFSLCSSAHSWGDGWKWPQLNPFPRKPKPPVSARVSDTPGQGWKMPSLWPSSTPSSSPAQPSLWGKMTSSTKNFFTKTADVLTPWDNKPASPPRSVTGSNSVFTNNGNRSSATQEKRGSILPASWWSNEKKEQPKSVSEFLSQPRPQ